MSDYPPENDNGEPLLYQDYFAAFENLIGTTGHAETYRGNEAAGAYEWIEIFEETGISTGSRESDIEAFEEFLIAFYPQDKSPDDWWLDRQEFYDDYGIDEHDIDWEAYRDAVGSP